MKVEQRCYHYLLHCLEQTILDYFHRCHNQLVLEIVLEIALHLYDFIILVNQVATFVVKVVYLNNVLQL